VGIEKEQQNQKVQATNSVSHNIVLPGRFSGKLRLLYRKQL